MMLPFFFMILRRLGAYTKKLTPSAPLTTKKGTWKDIFSVYAPGFILEKNLLLGLRLISL